MECGHAYYNNVFKGLCDFRNNKSTESLTVLCPNMERVSVPYTFPAACSHTHTHTHTSSTITHASFTVNYTVANWHAIHNMCVTCTHTRCFKRSSFSMFYFLNMLFLCTCSQSSLSICLSHLYLSICLIAPLVCLCPSVCLLLPPAFSRHIHALSFSRVHLEMSLFLIPYVFFIIRHFHTFSM